MKKLPVSFYESPNVEVLANRLLGKILVTKFEGVTTSGRIVETEAYAGTIDRASHAWNGRRTARNEVMYGKAGAAYVYLCYGLHYLFNVVTNAKDIPHAILIRALEPVSGIDTMLQRTGKIKADATLTRGPGNVSKALGINRTHNAMSLQGRELFIGDDGFEFENKEIAASPRIGVDYAGPHALWPYRFYVKGNPYVSGKPK